MDASVLLRVLFAALLATGAAVVVVEAPLGDRGGHRSPPGSAFPPGLASPPRRVLAGGVLATIFFLTLFLPALTGDLLPPEIDLATMRTADLFAFQALLVAATVAWGLLGWAGLGTTLPEAMRAAARELGLWARRPVRELAVGVGFGALAWAAVLSAALVAALVLGLFVGEEDLGELTRASPLVLWVAAQPVAVRVAVAVCAGVVEETFFRGLLQPRIGVLASSALFVLGHLAYGQPVLLVGIAVLSLLYAGLARWRGNVLAAIVAHALFDLVQLLVVIPLAVETLEATSGATLLAPFVTPSPLL